MGVDLTKYRSHEKKYLHQHLKNVVAGACERTSGKINLLIELASIFHDLGKINPNFQLKLDNRNHKEYSQHAYLSAIAWLCFYHENKNLLEKWKLSESEIFGIAGIVAHHHGNLPNLGTNVSRIFKNSGTANPTKLLVDFLRSKADKEIPISEYLETAALLPNNSKHKKFNLVDFDEDERDEYLDGNLYGLKYKDPLDLFQTLQFIFSSLIESDKRDASDNTVFKSKDLSKNFQDKFSVNLENYLQDIKTKSAEETDEKKKRLDAVRSQMREEALANLRKFLDEEKERRVFMLPAPTGAGKTFMLLSLANEILKHREDLSVIYALPFLAITEQTENICLGILKDDEKVLRVDSKSENKEIEKLQRILDDNPSDENVKKLLQQFFSNETFDHPFIITTFVQVFETLVSNRNATLLRLPNFSKTIFLLDEIQALPPSLYTFFVAYLDEFCRKFDSYAIVSTATMPHLKLPDEAHYKEREKPSKVFTRYEEPKKILDERFYKFDEFNRYKIIPKFEIKSISDLTEEIKGQKESCLIVLNTIKDTKNLYKELKGDYDSQTEESEYILLNSHFTLEDRQRKLAICQKRLKNKEKKEKVVLISTQLIEAGVDIDFPIVYRDLCPLPSLIQTAGRCNRNYKLDFGKVYFFEIKDKDGKSSAKKIYGRNFDWFLKFTRRAISLEICEKNMLAIQDDFAKTQISDALPFGVYAFGSDKETNLVECINQIRFEDFAKVKLIDADYGIQLRIYVSRSDGEFDELQELFEKGKLIPPRDFTQIRLHRSDVDKQLRKMSRKTVSVRIAENQLSNLNHLINEDEKLFEIYLINAGNKYSLIEGLKIEFEGGEII